MKCGRKMKTPELVLGQGQRWWGPNKKESNFLKKKGEPHKKELPQITLSTHPAAGVGPAVAPP